MTGKEICLRQMQPADVPRAAAIERTLFSDPWSEEGFLQTLAQPHALYVVAETEERLAGYCGLQQSFEEAEITNVAVDVWARRRGVAAAMLTKLMQLAAQRGVTRFLLEVRAGNEGAIRLYRRLGFEQIGIRKGFYTLPREDARIMERREPEYD